MRGGGGHWEGAALAALLLLGACDSGGGGTSAPDPSVAEAWGLDFETDPPGEAEEAIAEEPPASATAPDAGAPTRRARTDPHEAGAFDYLILALSWSPTFCDSPAGAREPMQCSAVRPYGFIVHGLWPQYERGWPESCPSTQPADVPRGVVEATLDLMPSRRLIEHQWDKHGVCVGGDPNSYFQRLRATRAMVRIPPEFERLSAPRQLTARELEASFLEANRALTPEGIVITCNRGRVREVRICFTREGAFRACGPDVRERCGDETLTMPPAR